MKRSLIAIVDDARAGDTLKLNVIRDRHEMQIVLRLEKPTQ